MYGVSGMHDVRAKPSCESCGRRRTLTLPLTENTQADSHVTDFFCVIYMRSLEPEFTGAILRIFPDWSSKWRHSAWKARGKKANAIGSGS